MTEPSADLIAELRAKLEKAVPGPWTFSPWHIEEADSAVRKDGYGIVANTAGDDTAAYIARCHPDNIRLLLDHIATLEAENAKLREEASSLAAMSNRDMLARLELESRVAKVEEERDEATNWSNIVDRHGTDQFDDLAEAWLALPAIQRVTNAVVSTFAKWANDDLMQRFRQHQLSMFHMAYVEGCLAGVKAAEAAREATK